MFFGCVEPYKGLDVLIRAFAALPADVRQQTQLLVAGTPNMDAAPLRQLARDLGVESQMVWRLNYIAEEEVPQLFREATLVVLPYRSIDQSGVLMTAVAFGKAIVASRIGGIPDVIEDGVHGLLVKPGDSQDLAQALQNLLTNPARRRSMEEATGHLAKTGFRGRRARKKPWTCIAKSWPPVEMVSATSDKMENSTAVERISSSRDGQDENLESGD